MANISFRHEASQQVKLLTQLKWWEDHVKLFSSSTTTHLRQQARGLTTIYEKSLGAVAKAANRHSWPSTTTPSRIDTPALASWTPRLRPVSMTGWSAAAALSAASPPAAAASTAANPPCIKIATNTPMYDRMRRRGHANAGTILDGTETLQQVGTRSSRKLSPSPPAKTKSEAAGIGDEEFAP
jgi:altronate hydrolase